jgi:WD40 repeat protein
MRRKDVRMNLKPRLRSSALPITKLGSPLLWLVGILVLAMVWLLVSSSLASAAPQSFPDVVPIPDNFSPEGIVVGEGTDFYVGSLVDGAIYRGDLQSGEGHLLVEGQGGRVAVGLSFDPRSNYLYVAGNGTGQGYVYDGETGEEIAVFDLTTPGTFINDVVVTQTAAYFTDSFRPFLYKVGLNSDGTIPASATPEEIELTGDFTQVAGFNANGIDATPNGKQLVIVNSTLGTLYTVNPWTGEAKEIDLSGDTVINGDGILLDGKTLYVVQNQDNQIAVIDLSPDLSSGRLVNTITDSDFVVPTTVAEFGNSLYAVNAKFGVPATQFEVVKVSK